MVNQATFLTKQKKSVLIAKNKVLKTCFRQIYIRGILRTLNSMKSQFLG